MTLTVVPLHGDFCARVTGLDIAPLDIAAGLDASTFLELRAAFEEYSVLVLPEQTLDDDQQVAFSELFGPLERTVISNPAGGSAFARQSNIDIKTGQTIPPDDRRMLYQKANMLWHADSTFKAVQSLCSILSARVVPPDGGATEFTSTRALYENLSVAERSEVAGLKVEHDIAYSRRVVGFDFTAEEAATMPSAVHPLVQRNPITGRKSLLLGAHAKSIVGWDFDKGRALLDDLLARATMPQNCYRHDWTEGELVIWDNRSVLHRATPYDNVRHHRLMQRTTVSLAG